MALVTTKRNVDVLPGQAAPTVFHCSQHDVGATVILGLVNAGGNFSIPSGVTAIIQGSCSNGAVFTPVTATVSGSDITFNLSAEMTSIAGPTVCEAVLSKDTDVLGTANFILDVEPSAMGSDTPPVFTDAAWLWMVDKMGTETVSALGNKTVIDAIESKLDKNQGTANSGKYLKVGADGNVETADLDVTTDKTLSVADKAADAKAVGDEITSLKADLNNLKTSGPEEKIFKFSSDLYLESTASNGKINASGSWRSDANYDILVYQVLEGEYVKVTTTDFFQFQTISRLPSGTNPNIVGQTYSAGTYYLEVPETAKYLLVSKLKSDETAEAHKVAINEPIAKELKTAFLSSEKSKIPFFTVLSEYVTTGGVITHHIYRKRTDYIPVSNIEYITASISTRTTTNCFYDENKNFISNFAIETTPTDIVIPENAYYMILSADNGVFETIDGTVTYKYERKWIKYCGDRETIYNAEASQLFDFEVGAIVNGIESDNRGAVRTKECVKLDYDLILIPVTKTDIRFAVFSYDTDNTTLLNSTAWRTSYYVVPAGSNFRLVVGWYSGAATPHLKNAHDVLKYLYIADSYYALTHIFDNSLRTNPNAVYKMPFIESTHRGIGETNLHDNTYYAILNSAKYGFNAIEIDVRTTVDNVMVLWHDATISGTLNGESVTLTIANETYERLKGLVIGTHYTYGDITICSLDDALDLIWKYGLIVNIDCKDVSVQDIALKVKQANLCGKAYYFNFADIVNTIPMILAIDAEAKLGVPYHAPTLENIKNSGVDMSKIIVWQNVSDITSESRATIMDYGCMLLIADVTKNSVVNAVSFHPDMIEYNSMKIDQLREAQDTFRNS